MKKKSLRMIILALMMIFTMAFVSGCSFSKDDPASEKTESEKEDDEDADEEDDEEEESEEEDEDDEDEWTANLDITQQPQTTEDPIEENVDAVCTCLNLCSTENINSNCLVCSEDFHKCIGTPAKDPHDEFALPAGQTETVSIMAVGSNFYNTAVMNGTDKSYNYDYIYENIKEVLKNYDVKIVTQETVFTNDPSKYSGSAPYKTPPSIANALTNAGFNVVASATDHAFDNGKEGIVETLNAWKTYQNTTLVAGIYASEESYNNICMADVNGIRIAFLSYTSSLNGTTLTNDEKVYVKTLYDEDTVAEEIKYASDNADYVIVMPHWGSENATKHTENQEKWAQVFIENGADAIIGTGSNVMQDVTLYQNEEGQVIPCYYSLGNFVSPKSNPNEVMSGAATITISKTGKVVTLEDYDMLPLALHVSKKGDFFKSYLLSEYPEDTIKWHNLIQNGKDLSIQGMEEQFGNTVEIIELKNFNPQEETIGLVPIQSQRPNSSAEINVDTETENDGQPLVDENNENNSKPASLGGLQVIGG